MKKRIVAATFAWMLAALLATGCGNTEAPMEEVAAEIEEAEETVEETEEAVEAAGEEAEEEPQESMVTVYLPVRCTSGGTLENEMEYDAHGNLIKSICYWDEQVSGVNEIEYEYGDDGRIVKETTYEILYDYEGNAEGDRIKNSEEEYEYGDDGTLLKSIKTEWYELDEFELEEMPELAVQQRVWESEYDEYANVVKEYIFESHPDGSEDSFEFTYEHEYGENGIIVKSVENRADSDVKVVREYDEYGNQTDAYQAVPDDSGLTPGWEKCEYTYDEQGRVIETFAYAHEFLTEGKYTTKYEYDANGNVIKITEDGGYTMEYEYMEMQIPDIKNYHKDNDLTIYGLRYIRI